MSDEAAEFLTAWSLKREHLGPLSKAEAAQVGARWEEEAIENGIDPAALRQAAGGEISDYLLRTYGDADDELSI